jgi:D-xylose transport system substrate-binding protein
MEPNNPISQPGDDQVGSDVSAPIEPINNPEAELEQAPTQPVSEETPKMADILPPSSSGDGLPPLTDASAVPGVVPSPTPAQGKSKKKLLMLAVVALLIVGGATAFWYWHSHKSTKSTASTTTPQISRRIGISMDTLKELRWQKDHDLLLQRAQQLGSTAIILVANGDDATQVSQIENLISQKVDVLIIVPHSSDPVVPTIEEAHKAGIKVLSYDRLILNGDVDAYVSFNNEEVGKNSAQYVVNALPANKVAKIAIVGGAPTDNNATQIHTGVMEILNPLITANKLQVVYDKPTTEWNPDLAYSNLKEYLATGATIDGVIAANDGTAGGAIKALQEKGLAGKIPVTGQDAELPAIQRLVAGTQTMTNYKPIKTLADKAIEMALAMANGKQPSTNAVTNNTKKQVPSYLLKPTPVTKDNIKATVIKDGFYTLDQVYGSSTQ